MYKIPLNIYVVSSSFMMTEKFTSKFMHASTFPLNAHKRAFDALKKMNKCTSFYAPSVKCKENVLGRQISVHISSK